MKNHQPENPAYLLYTGDYTTQFYRDYDKPPWWISFWYTYTPPHPPRWQLHPYGNVQGREIRSPSPEPSERPDALSIGKSIELGALVMTTPLSWKITIF